MNYICNVTVDMLTADSLLFCYVSSMNLLGDFQSGSPLFDCCVRHVSHFSKRKIIQKRLA